MKIKTKKYKLKIKVIDRKPYYEQSSTFLSCSNLNSDLYRPIQPKHIYKYYNLDFTFTE